MGYVDDINFFEENVATVKNNVEILPQASKEIALKLSKDKIKYINMTSNQNQKHIWYVLNYLRIFQYLYM